MNVFINCRKDNMCLLCKYWLGGEANVNYISGKTKREICSGICSLDAKEHKSVDICAKFEKCLIYL